MGNVTIVETTTADFTAGTPSGTQAGTVGGGDLEIQNYANDFSSLSTSGLTLFGSSSPTQDASTGALKINVGSATVGTQAHDRLDNVPAGTSFVFQCDVTLPANWGSGAEIGFTFGNTASPFGTGADTYANIFRLTKTQTRAGYGSNSSASSAGTFSTPVGYLNIGGLGWNAGETHTLTFLFGANLLRIYADGSAFTSQDFSSSPYLAAGQLGLWCLNCATGNEAVFDNLFWSLPQGTWVSPVHDISAVGIVSSATVSWTDNSALFSGTAVVDILADISTDGGVTWAGPTLVAASGDPYPNVTAGQDLSTARIQFSVILAHFNLPLSPPTPLRLLDLTGAFVGVSNPPSPVPPVATAQSLACSNAASGTPVGFSQTVTLPVNELLAPLIGQPYFWSLYYRVTSACTNLSAALVIAWLDATGTPLQTVSQSFSLASSTQWFRASQLARAPQGAAQATVSVQITPTSSTNSGTVIFTGAQFEYATFAMHKVNAQEQTALQIGNYPTPYCDPGQPGCYVDTGLSGLAYRQQRLFGGFARNVHRSYQGPERFLLMKAVDYSVLLDEVEVNQRYDNQTDSSAIQSAVSYAQNLGFCVGVDAVTFVATIGVAQGLLFPWTKVRDIVNKIGNLNVAAVWMDYYKRLHYQPALAISAPYALSDAPDFVTSFPFEAFEFETDTSDAQTGLIIEGKTLFSSPQVETQLGDGHTTAFTFNSGNPIERPDSLLVGPVGSQVAVTIGMQGVNDFTQGYGALLDEPTGILTFQTPPVGASGASAGTTETTQEDFATGIVQNTLALISAGGPSRYRRDWNDGSTSGQTVFGNGTPSQAVLATKYTLLPDAGFREAHSRFDAAGQLADFFLECDVTLPSTSQGGSGPLEVRLLWRTTQWAAADFTYAYVLRLLSSGFVDIGYGTNAGSTGAYTALYGPVANSSLTPGSTHHVTIAHIGSTLTVCIDGVVQTTLVDGTYNTAGYFGVSVANASDAFIDNFLVYSLATSNGELQPANYSRTWDDNLVTNQSLFGGGTPAQTATAQQFRLTTSASAQALSCLGDAPVLQGFCWEIDVTLPNSGSAIGVVYRTGGWQNTADTYGYVVKLTTTTIELGTGSNTSTGVGSFTSLSGGPQPLGPFAAGTPVRLRVFVQGNNHQAYVNGTLLFSINDSTYLGAGQVGLYAENCTTGNEAFFDNSLIVASDISPSISGGPNPCWRLSPPVNLSSVLSVGSSVINWNATLPPIATFFLQTSLSTDGGVTWGSWQNCTSGQAIPGLTPGMSLSTTWIRFRQGFSINGNDTTDPLAVPSLQNWTFQVAAGGADTLTLTYRFVVQLLVRQQQLAAQSSAGSIGRKIHQHQKHEQLTTRPAAVQLAQASLRINSKSKPIGTVTLYSPPCPIDQPLYPGTAIPITFAPEGLDQALFQIQQVSLRPQGNDVLVRDLALGFYKPDLTALLAQQQRKENRLGSDLSDTTPLQEVLNLEDGWTLTIGAPTARVVVPGTWGGPSEWGPAPSAGQWG